MQKLSIQTNIWSTSLVDEWVSTLPRDNRDCLTKWDILSKSGTLGQKVGHLDQKVNKRIRKEQQT